MRITGYIFTLILVVLISACEKKRYPDNVVENDTIFYFEGTVNGALKRYSAGKGNYYMYSSHQNNGGLLQFSGDLIRTDCPQCSGIRFVLNDNHLSQPGSGLSDSSLKTESYTFARETDAEFNVSFVADYNKNAASYLWNFGDGVQSTEASPVHKYLKPGKYTVCLSVTSDNGCVSQVCNTEDFSANAFRTQIHTQQLSANTISFTQSTTGTGPFSFYWNFGDGTTSTLSSPQHTYKINGSYPVTLRVTDASGMTITSQYNTVTGNDASSCAVNFRIGNVDQLQPKGFLETAIRWVDDQGREYFTAKVDQPANSFFKVTNVEDFEPNEKNEPTKKVSVKFSCVLSNGINTINIDNATAVIAVAHP